MCGLVGEIRLDGGKPDLKIIRKMTDALRHRGPDDEGYFADGPVSFGFRRLAILDLSPSGHQPMHYKHHYTIVFNGEVYNYLELKKELEGKGYTFRSQSDTEVILAAYDLWGERCVEYFNGMWGMVVWDRHKKQLFLARDRMGIKPLYYFQDVKTLVFASEIKALLAHPAVPRRPNDRRIFSYLAYALLDQDEETFFAGIKQVIPATTMIIHEGKIRRRTYWDLDSRREVNPDDCRVAEQFVHLFTDAVSLHLRSDVPVGTCLSGGLDSSSIVAVVNRLLRTKGIASVGERQKTFSACYHRFDRDETRHIDTMIRDTGATCYKIYPTAEQLRREVDDLIWHQDEPFGSTSIFAQRKVFEIAGRQKIKVMLDGQGADELLAGYFGYFGAFLAENLRHLRFGRVLGELFLFWVNHRYPIWQNAVDMCFSLLPPFAIQLFSRPILAQSPLAPDFVNRYFYVPTPPPKYANVFKNYLYYFFRTASLPALLHYEDRNSMTYSIEARVPFLDYRLVEYIFSLPDKQKIRHGTTKWVLREAMKDILPESIRTRQDKIGFETPEEQWFKGPLQQDIRAILRSRSFTARPYFDIQRVQELFDHFIAGRAALSSSTVWRWVNLELWLRKFIDQR